MVTIVRFVSEDDKQSKNVDWSEIRLIVVGSDHELSDEEVECIALSITPMPEGAEGLLILYMNNDLDWSGPYARWAKNVEWSFKHVSVIVVNEDSNDFISYALDSRYLDAFIWVDFPKDLEVTVENGGVDINYIPTRKKESYWHE